MIKIYKREIHGGRGYDLGDRCDIQDKVIEFFGNSKWVIIIQVNIETDKNIYTFNPFGYKWISKKEI